MAEKILSNESNNVPSSLETSTTTSSIAQTSTEQHKRALRRNRPGTKHEVNK